MSHAQPIMITDLNYENQFSQLSFMTKCKKAYENQHRRMEILKWHLLNSVLGVGFALPTHRGGRVQKAMLPYGISSIAIECLDHLKHETTEPHIRLPLIDLMMCLI